MRVLPHKGRKMVDDDEKGNHRVSHECIKRNRVKPYAYTCVKSLFYKS